MDIKEHQFLRLIAACLAAGTIGVQTTMAANADRTATGESSVSSASPPNATLSTPGSPYKPPLEGRVEEQQEESLPAIEDKFRSGTTFDEAKLTALTPDNIWIQTPEWFGGKWHSETESISYMYDYKTGMASPAEHIMKAVANTTYGMQRSKDGQLWTFVKLPRIAKTETEFGYAYLYALREDLLKYTDTKLVIKFFYYEIRTDSNNTILGVERVSSINTYTQLDEGLVRLKASMKSFDEEGQPKLLQFSEKVLKQTAPYEEVDEYSGLNLKQLFVEFLKKSGKEDQIPT
ncbi:MAG: hypothetical protein C5B53_00515 [Candidatus Melainabacteria bacterium]|nr:MAG: hypothetical protein C5B53_00515 [Candidatus Melainabacteria bacterium]